MIITETSAPSTRRLQYFKLASEMLDKVAFKMATQIRFEDEGITVRPAQKAALTRMIRDMQNMHGSGEIRQAFNGSLKEMKRRGVFTEDQLDRLYYELQNRIGII